MNPIDPGLLIVLLDRAYQWSKDHKIPLRQALEELSKRDAKPEPAQAGRPTEKPTRFDWSLTTLFSGEFERKVAPFGDPQRWNQCLAFMVSCCCRPERLTDPKGQAMFCLLYANYPDQFLAAMEQIRKIIADKSESNDAKIMVLFSRSAASWNIKADELAPLLGTTAENISKLRREVRRLQQEP